MFCFARCQNLPEVGSSTKMTGASPSTSVAKERRFFSPPEMPRMTLPCPPIVVSAHLPVHATRAQHLPALRAWCNRQCLPLIDENAMCPAPRHCGGATVYSHTTTAMHWTSTPPHPRMFLLPSPTHHHPPPRAPLPKNPCLIDRQDEEEVPDGPVR